jgi:tRNA1(Val) A37 N6-methylase TrmN6
VKRILIHHLDSYSQRKIDLVGITYRFSASISSQLINADLQHHLYTLSLDGALGLAPPNSKGSRLNRVLDVGTGTGIWAIDFGMLS